MMRGWGFGIGAWTVVLSLLVFGSPVRACETDGRYIMGTVFQATLCQAESTPQARMSAVWHEVFATAGRFDDLFTIYAPHSPLSHLNAQAGRGLQAVPAEVSDILRLSRRYADLTNGAFDITVRPLLSLWRHAATTQTQPTAAAIRRTLGFIGSQKLHFAAPHRVGLPAPGMALDLGGIGKGYALDRIARQLHERRLTNALLNFGQSSLWASGRPPDGEGWRLLLRQPNGEIVGVATFSDQAVSISGSLGQSMQVEGRRYGHIIDPRTGRPVQRDLLACVVAPSAAQAEALSTALLILGEREGLDLIEQLDGVEGFLREAHGTQWMTTGWERVSRFVALVGTTQASPLP